MEYLAKVPPFVVGYVRKMKGTAGAIPCPILPSPLPGARARKPHLCKNMRRIPYSEAWPSVYGILRCAQDDRFLKNVNHAVGHGGHDAGGDKHAQNDGGDGPFQPQIQERGHQGACPGAGAGERNGHQQA